MLKWEARTIRGCFGRIPPFELVHLQFFEEVSDQAVDFQFFWWQSCTKILVCSCELPKLEEVSQEMPVFNLSTCSFRDPARKACFQLANIQWGSLHQGKLATIYRDSNWYINSCIVSIQYKTWELNHANQAAKRTVDAAQAQYKTVHHGLKSSVEEINLPRATSRVKLIHSSAQCWVHQ